MEVDSDSVWSDYSDDDEGKARPLLQSRAYQIEIFEASLQQNIIAVVRFALSITRSPADGNRWAREAARH